VEVEPPAQALLVLEPQVEVEPPVQALLVLEQQQVLLVLLILVHHLVRQVHLVQQVQ
jgi:hypothetical protein